MGSSNIVRLLQAAWLNGSDPFRLSSSQTLTVRPVADDTGTYAFGDGTTDMDVKIFVGATTDFALFDVGNGQFTLDNMELNLGDSDELEFGDGAAGAGDVYVAWDGTDLDMTAAVDDSVFKIGTGTISFDVWLYGNIPTSYLVFDASADEFQLRGPVRPRGFKNLGRRFELGTQFDTGGVPQLNAGIDTSAATHAVSSSEFEILGVNAVNTSVTRAIGGGILLTTAGADGDEVILLPHLDTNVSPWTTTTWPTSRELEWECHIATNANVTAQIIWAGLKLTNTELISTDDNAVWFRYENDVASGSWQSAASIATVDTVVNSSAAVAVNTEYHLKIVIASDRTAQMYINGALERTTAALASTNLIPYIGVATDGATAAKSISVFGQALSRIASVVA